MKSFINTEDKEPAFDGNIYIYSNDQYAKKDLNYKPLGSVIEDFAVCRRYRSNFLLNVGPMGDGSLRPMDKAMYIL